MVENYHKSKKDLGKNKINRRTQVKPEKLYKKYRDNDGDFEEITSFNQIVYNLADKGYVTFEREKFGTLIICIYMIDESLSNIEKFLYEKYGYESKEMHREEVKRLISKYEKASFICSRECDRLRRILENNKIPKDYFELDLILKAIAFIEKNEEDLYIREASMEIYGESKFFENNTLQQVCKMLRNYTSRPCDNDEFFDEILMDYHIKKEPQKVCLKGKIVLCIDGEEINLSSLTSGIEFAASELAKIDYIRVLVPKFMTIENRTSYLRYSDGNTVVFYLGGYANRFQRDFIKKVFLFNPNVEYLHFGDIDAGGFWIHHNLCEITGVNFSMFHMSVEELKNKDYVTCLRVLSNNDVSRLSELREINKYTDTVCYMLEHNVKLEQEIVSLKLMKQIKGRDNNLFIHNEQIISR